MSDSVQPHRRQPTRLRCPWDSSGKNTGVGCHFLLQCIKVKRESEVTHSCLTLSDPVDCSLPGSSIHGIFQTRVLEWGAIAFSGIYTILSQPENFNSLLSITALYKIGLNELLVKFKVNPISGSFPHDICVFCGNCPSLGNGTPLQYSCLETPMDGGAFKAAVHGVTEGRTRLSDFTFTFHFHALEKEMATYSSVLTWRIPGTGEPGGLLSMGSHRVGHD